VLDDGRLTDGQGRTVDFKNAIVVMTSNFGSSMIQELTASGAEDWEIDLAVRDLLRRGPAAAAIDEVGKATGMPKHVREAVLRAQQTLLATTGGGTFLRPELLNRIDEVVVFHQLKQEHIRDIVDIQFARLRQRLASRGITIEITPAAADLLAAEGWDPAFGARPLKRVVQQRVENVMASKLLAGEIVDGSKIRLEASGDRLVFGKGE
jgi:ATP-dependent Clp protease ATP-binding subunit ClpB